MITLPGCDEYRGIYYYRSQRETETFYYLPAEPVPERDTQGRPTLLLFASDHGAILQLGTRWEPEAGLLEELRVCLGRKLQIVPALIRLRPVSLTISQVTLSVRDGEGNLTQLQSTSSSGYPPFSAIFNVTLTAEQKLQAIAALGGREGTLVVTYQGAATLHDSMLSKQEYPHVTKQSLISSTDVGTWFAKGGGLEHLQMIAVTIGEQPQLTGRKVRLAFEAKGVPVVYVQVIYGKAVEILRSPDFSPVMLSVAETDMTLIVKTAYTTGGTLYETKVTSPGPEGWALTPSDLGMAQIVLNATARRTSGAKTLRVRVRYLPLGEGIEDEQLITFRYGDWVQSWFIVTRSAGLDGQLRVNMEETFADGSVVKHPLITTANTSLIL